MLVPAPPGPAQRGQRMFGHKAKSSMDSLIGPATWIDGDLLFRGGLRIDGRVRGNVVAENEQDSYLVVSEHATIEGAVRCAHLIVNGTIQGDVHVSELLEIQPKARILGDISYKVLEIHAGAQVQGRLTHFDCVDNPLHLAATGA
jgi:cytoskeletal protein CcmA (bactofilin family)